MPFDILYTSPYLLLVAAALGLYLISGRWPRVARALFIAVFAAMASAAVAIIVASPQAILDRARLAPIASYRSFVESVIAPHLAAMALAVATVLALVALGLGIGGRPARLATVAAIALLLLVVPFGAGTAFPVPLFLAAALWLVSRSPALLDEPVGKHRLTR